MTPLERLTGDLNRAQEALIDYRVGLATRQGEAAFQAAQRLYHNGWEVETDRCRQEDDEPENVTWQGMEMQSRVTVRRGRHHWASVSRFAALGLDGANPEGWATLRYLADLTEEMDEVVLASAAMSRNVIKDANQVLEDMVALRGEYGDVPSLRLWVNAIDTDRKVLEIHLDTTIGNFWEHHLDLSDVRPILHVVKRSLRLLGWRTVRLVGFGGLPRTVVPDLRDPVTVLHYLAGVDLP